jgi:glucosamine kinase
MATMPTVNEDTLFLGIDGGGSKCRARIFSGADVELGTGVGGPANPLHGVQQTIDSITKATELALVDAGLPSAAIAQLIAGVGLAGVNLPSLFQVMSSWHHPFQKMFLTTDLHIACLGAHNRDEGAVMVAGTGSCGYAFVKGVPTILGAHGFPFGDKGSGAWMGLETVKAVLLASDHLGPNTLLSDLVGEFLQAKGVMIVDKMIAAKSSDYARLASFVLEAAEQKDPVALSILKDGAAYMSEVAEKLWETGATRMSFIGGLSERLTEWLDPAIAARLSSPIGQPEFGAAYYAKQQYGFLLAGKA